MYTDYAAQIAAETGNTNGGLKLNRLRLWRAERWVEYYRHITSGGRPDDLVSIELGIAITKLTEEIEANERLEAAASDIREVG